MTTMIRPINANDRRLALEADAAAHHNYRRIARAELHQAAPEPRAADDDAWRQYCNYEGPCEPAGHKITPCDSEPYTCPYMTTGTEATSSLWCRNHCGLGADKA